MSKSWKAVRDSVFENGQLIATAPLTTYNPNTSKKEVLANMRMMAAAQDLFEVCRRMVKDSLYVDGEGYIVCVYCLERSDGHKNVKHASVCLSRVARAALDKAKEEED